MKVATITTWKRCIASMMTVCVLCLLLTSCGGRPSGKFVPANPDDANVLFDSMDFKGGTVRIEASGSSIALDYTIKDNMFKFKNNFTFTVSDQKVPASLLFNRNDDGSFKFGDVLYVPAD